MASSAIESATKWVGNLLVEEIQLLAGVSDQVEELNNKLELLNSFLWDADLQYYKNATIRQTISEIRDLALKAEDIIETYILEVSHKREKPRGLIPWTDLMWLLCCLRDAKTLHGIGHEIGNLTAEIKELTNDLRKCGIQAAYIKMSELYYFPDRGLIELRQTYSHIEDDIIGLDEDVTDVANKLLSGKQKIVVIHGMGGIGKTTLARKVYNDASLKREFERFAWAYVSQHLQLGPVCRDILLQIVPEERSTIKEMSETELVTKLFQELKSKKCLVVLDDIWYAQDWEKLKHAFPVKDASCESRLLVTTRDKEIIPTSPGGVVHQHESKLLDRDRAWELFQQKADFHKDNAEPSKVELAENMLRHCNGHPLAIIVLGGILATKNSLEEWQLVHDDLSSHLKGDDPYGGVYGILALSYYALPYHLKACFLNLGYFPEDFEIPAQTLYHLWIAEGIVTSTSNQATGSRSLEDTAKVYLNKLVQKGLVQVVTRDVEGNIEICRLHDLMRDKCLEIAKEEKFLQIVDGVRSVDDLSGRLRFLAIHGNPPELQKCLPNSSKVPHLRSLLFFPAEDWESERFEKLFKDFKLLRIFGVGENFLIGKLTSSIGDLVYLRYLSLFGARVDELPYEIGNLKSLLILDLRVDSNMRLPNVLWKLKSLRELYLPAWFVSLDNCTINPNYIIEDGEDLSVSNLSNLEILEGVLLDTVDLQLTGIRKLRAFCSSKIERLDPILKSSSIKSMRLTIAISLLVDHPMVLANCSSLHHLQLLRGQQANSTIISSLILPQNIVSLSCFGLTISEEFLSVLEKLPCLKQLSLSNCDGFSTWHISSNGFPELIRLVIIYLNSLRKLIVEEGGLRKLKKLVICEALIELVNLPPHVSVSGNLDDF